MSHNYPRGVQSPDWRINHYTPRNNVPIFLREGLGYRFFL